MNNKQVFPAALAVTLLLILMPAPSRAASRSREPLSRPAASLLEKIERWLGLSLNGTENPRPTPVWEKQGCGMDPNGNPLCPGTTTQETEPSGSGGN
jgi:hypothetical protein